MEQETVARAFELFGNKEYTAAKEVLRGGIKQHVNDHLKSTLGLEADPIVHVAAADDDPFDGDE